ncbi:MAG TPA: VOC family protein [Vicinamibacterales bacterium]|nr:VOC family protein [Vicinamibacterales bacterium]
MKRIATIIASAVAAWLLTANPTTTASLAASSASSDGSVSAVDAISMVVADADRSAAFFTDVLTFEKVSDVEVDGAEHERLEGVFGLRLRIVRMKLGSEFLELLQFIAPEGRPVPVDSRSNDRWFQHVAIIVRDMDQAYARLRQHKVRHASSGPQRLPDWNKNAGGIQAFYFKDPDGHALEILAFPPDKGAARWHAATDRLFLGIDHTAIVVDDTDTSLRFYRDGLGLKVAGESENYGIEQERLNNVFGARLRITGLTAGAGPAIEFLDYLAPDDGRPAPADLKSNDLVSWQTRLLTADIKTTTLRLRPRTFAFVSPGIVALREPAFGFQTGALVRDPDGHAVMLAQK